MNEMMFNSETVFGVVKIIMLKGEKGDTGASGTSGNYTQLTNKPSINNVTLSGNKTSSDLGLASQANIDDVAQDLSDLDADVYRKDELYTKSELYPKSELYTKSEVYPKTSLITRQNKVQRSGSDYVTDSITFDSSVDMSKLVVLSCEQSVGEATQSATPSAFYSSYNLSSDRSYPYYVVIPAQKKLEIHAYCPSDRSYVTTRCAYMFA